MRVIYNSANIPFYTGITAPESSFDDQFAQIPDGIFYIDTLSHNVYIMSSAAWTLVTDSSTFSSLVPNSATITSGRINTIGGFNITRVEKSTYYTSTFNNVISISFPQTVGNAGSWIALEDNFGKGYNIMSDFNTGKFRVVDRVGGINGVSTKHYFFCDGIKWHLAKSFLPVTGAATTTATNTIYVDADNGSDTTGVKYDSAKPFKTVSQALYLAVSGDLIYIRKGLYTDYNMNMKNGVEVFMEKGATISPTANNGYVPIFKNYGTGYNSGVAQTFKIYGRGRLINLAGTSSSGVCSIENHSTLNIYLEAEEVSILSIYANNLGTASFTIYNTMISMELYTRGGMWSLNNCVIKDCKTTTFNMDWGGAQVQFNNCTFIRQQTTIPFEQSYNVNIIGQNIINGAGSQGLTNFAFGPTTGNGGNRKTAFINCTFYNLIGGDAITFRNTTSNNATLVISGCRFYSSNNTKNALLADGVSGVPTTPNYYFDNNISNMALGTVNGGTVANLLTGSGFQINSNYFIANPLPYTAYVTV
jgi:hypothetical protein